MECGMKKFIYIVLLICPFMWTACENKLTHLPGEGSESDPVEITVDTPYAGQVGPWVQTPGESFYQFEVLNNDIHTISLTNMETDLGWELYDTTGFVDLLDECDEKLWPNDKDPGDEIKETTNTLNAGGTYYLKVLNHGGMSSTFTLTVTDSTP